MVRDIPLPEEVQRARHAGNGLQQVVFVHSVTLAQEPRERRPVHVFHRAEVGSVRLPGLVHRDEMGMHQGGIGARFFQKVLDLTRQGSNPR